MSDGLTTPFTIPDLRVHDGPKRATRWARRSSPQRGPSSAVAERNVADGSELHAVSPDGPPLTGGLRAAPPIVLLGEVIP
jgi:hypothetical protein